MAAAVQTTRPPIQQPARKATPPVTCKVCGHTDMYLGVHLQEAHQMSVAAYEAKYPDAEIANSDLRAAFQHSFKGERKALDHSNMTIQIAGYNFPVYWEVREQDCLPVPNYFIPTHGQQAQQVKRAARAIRGGRPLWIAGEPGTGKDVFVHYVCGVTRRPSLILQINPTADLESWFFEKNFSDGGKLVWTEGMVLKALRDGYVSTTGQRIPYIILLSDLDRSTPAQAEILRLILDSTQGRIQCPTGDIYDVLPGTLIIATANSTGSGDETGRCVSSNIMDASIMDRFKRHAGFVNMEWGDVQKVLEAKFTLMAGSKNAANMFAVMAKVTREIRRGISTARIIGLFSQRKIEDWAEEVEDILRFDRKELSLAVMREGFQSWLDGLPDETNRKTALELVKDIFSKGVDLNTVAEDSGDLRV